MITISITNSDDPGTTLLYEGDLCLFSVSKASDNRDSIVVDCGVLGEGNPTKVAGTQTALLTAVSKALGDNTPARRELVMKTLEIIDPVSTALAKSITGALRGGAKHEN